MDRLVAAGIACCLLAFALPGSAYHIRDNPAGGDDGFEPLQWTGALGVDFPVTDPFTNDQDPCAALRALQDILGPTVREAIDLVLDLLCLDSPSFTAGQAFASFQVCEENADPSLSRPATSGLGGLCNMSQGCGGGVSNGAYNAYDGLGCKDAETEPQTAIPAWAVTPTWVAFRMTVPGVGPVPFVGEVAGTTCGFASSTFVVDEQFLYTVSAGHLNGYPKVSPSAGAFGSYTVGAGSPAGMTNCALLPMYY